MSNEKLVKFKIFRIFDSYHFYDDYDAKNRSVLFANLDWEMCTYDEFLELQNGVNLINSKSKKNYERLIIIEAPEFEEHQELIELSRKAVCENTKQLKAAEEKRKKIAEEKKAEKEQKALERKKKQLEKLKQELGEE